MKFTIKKLRAIILYEDYYKPYLLNLLRIINYLDEQGRKLAIWGYGYKGEAFLQMLGTDRGLIRCVFDMNPMLHGTYTSSKHPIISYRDMKEYNIDTIFVMNKVFYADIERVLHNEGYNVKLIDLDELIENEVTLQDFIEGKNKKREETSYEMRDLQMVTLGIMKEVDRICKKHDIHYFLSAGTALGAIRHQGFIPWDEDIDIGMLRSDFDHFRSIIRQELTEEYYYQTLEKGKENCLPFDQIMKNNTAYVRLELSQSKTHHGLHIDIFPFDNVSHEEEKREEQMKKVLKYRNLLKQKLTKQIFNSKNPIKNLIIHSNYYVMKLVPFNYLKKKMEESLTLYKNIETGLVADLCTHYKKIMYFKKEDIFPAKLALFEDMMFPVPNNVDAYLTTMYGDYMTPPPEGKRQQKCRLVEVSCDKNYYLDDLWLKKGLKFSNDKD